LQQSGLRENDGSIGKRQSVKSLVCHPTTIPAINVETTTGIAIDRNIITAIL